MRRTSKKQREAIRRLGAAAKRRKTLSERKRGEQLIPMKVLKALQMGLPNDLRAYNAKLQEFLQGASNAAREAAERK